MHNLEKRSVHIELEPIAEGTRTLEGYAHTFSNEYTKLRDRWGDSFFEKIVKGAFVKSIANTDRDIFMLVNHDWNKIIGRTSSNLTISEDEKGLKFSVEVPNTSDGNDLLENVRLKLITGCSFGFNIINAVEKWDETYSNFYRDITDLDLFEITATALPCYENTEISARSTLSLRDIKPKAPTEKQIETDGITKQNNGDVVLSFLEAFIN